MPVTQDEVFSALKECYDPEIPVNIVDLGLIYEIRVAPPAPAENQPQDVQIVMTMTSPGCPAKSWSSQSGRPVAGFQQAPAAPPGFHRSIPGQQCSPEFPGRSIL